jgi:Zn-dependent protease with chaperone function
LYVLAVAAIVACVDGMAALFYFVFSYKTSPSLYLIASLGTLAVIALGTLEVIARLLLGQGEFAELLSGRPVGRNSGRDDEQRLVNIVDELSIASGLAAPPLYVLNREQGINAFAAGASPGQAVIVVTQGALEQLSRDELQAVIAHEFSHILNGDIRLNLRAVYVLQGIVFLSAIGRFMMQYYSGAGTEEGRSFFSLPFAAVGVGVFAVGSVGLFFCRIIQASISRERENLADASAVRFTRNADALCGALARIQVNASGSRLRNWHADALAHMLFAPPSPGWLSTLIATHPPIEERMRRINPRMPPTFYIENARRPRIAEQKQVAEQAPPRAKPATVVPRRVTGVVALIATIGKPDGGHLEYAAELLSYLTPQIREALGEPAGAQAVMFGCLLDEELTNRERQLRALRSHDGESLARKAEVIAPYLRQLDRAYRLPLVALATPVLKRLDEPARAAFLAALRAVIQADERVTLSEFVLATILDWTIGPHARRAGAVRYNQRAELAAEIALVLSLLAYSGSSDAAQVQAAFDKGRDAMGMPALVLEAKDKLQFTQVSIAFVRLAELAGAEKERLLAGFGAAIAADDDVKLLEHELLRAVACVLDCPMPPSIAALDPRLLRK